MKTQRFHRLLVVTPPVAVLLAVGFAMTPLHTPVAAVAETAERGTGDYVVFGFNDLGMHCMQDDFSEMMILPPFNNVHAQVIRRSANGEPDIIDEQGDISVQYSVPSNTHADDKTNFWRHAEDLLGVQLPPNVGLTGNGLSGEMTPTANRDWEITGVPFVPTDDDGRVNPYLLGTVSVLGAGGNLLAQTQTVVPVSTELSCHLCHGGANKTPALDILEKHDAVHGTDLVNARPVLCASCHADPALGAPGLAGIPALSTAIHGSHADRLASLKLDNECYACHPGLRTQCQRDVHFSIGFDCHECHVSMQAVGSPNRTPWVDEPRCANCHSRPGFEFEEPGRLFRESRGHEGVMCATCHGSPHAITPAATMVDNLQAIVHQGFAGVISDCTVCHTQMPNESFPHRFDP